MSVQLVLTSEPTPAGVVTITLNNPKKLVSPPSRRVGSVRRGL